MTDKFMALRTVMPWYEAHLVDLVTGRRQAQPEIAKSPTAYSCMQIRGNELANIPWHIKRNDKILDNHPLIDLLEDFGPESNWQQAMLFTEIDKCSQGAALWLRDVNRLVKLNPGNVKVLKNADGIKGFEHTVQEGTKTIKRVYKRDEVVYFRAYHPDDDLDFGVPILDVCKRAVEAEIEAIEMIKWHYANDATPGLFLSSDQDVTQAEAERVLTWWEKRFRGPRKKGKVGVAGKGLKPVPVSTSMRDAGVMDLFEINSANICKAFRVDPILLGGNVNATYVNLSESRRFLIEDVVLPEAIQYQNAINQDLVNIVDPGVVFEFAFDEIQILQEDATEKHIRLFQAVQAGIISKDFYREEMGYPPDSEPDETEQAEQKAKQEAAEAKWEKKAVKALLKGESPAVEFETDNISIDRQYVIRGRLHNAQDVEAVRACFQ